MGLRKGYRCELAIDAREQGGGSHPEWGALGGSYPVSQPRPSDHRPFTGCSGRQPILRGTASYKWPWKGPPPGRLLAAASWTAPEGKQGHCSDTLLWPSTLRPCKEPWKHHKHTKGQSCGIFMPSGQGEEPRAQKGKMLDRTPI